MNPEKNMVISLVRIFTASLIGIDSAKPGPIIGNASEPQDCCSHNVKTLASPE